MEKIRRSFLRSLTLSAYPAIALLLVCVAARIVWLGLAHSSAAAPAPYWALLQEDIAVVLFVTALWLMLHAIVLASKPYLEGLLSAALLLLFGGTLIASCKYYLNYETPFRLSHLVHVEGAAQMTQSIAAELNAATLIGAIALLIFTAAWIALLMRRLSAERSAYAIMPNSQLAWLRLGPALGSLALLLLSFLARATIPETGHERAYNIFYRVLLDPGQAESGSRSSGGSSISGVGKEAFSATKGRFEFRFNSDSLADAGRQPRILFPGRGQRKNIVLYLFEGTASEYVGRQVNGKALTPNWDRLAQNSIRFTNHRASNPLTINALFSILASAYPLPMDRWAIKDYPDLPVRTLPQILSAAGYRTAIFNTGYFKYGGQIHFLRGRSFDVIADVNQLRRPPFTQTLNWGIDDRALIDPAVSFAKKQKSPFFILLKPETPHHPYDIPEPRFAITNPNNEKSFRKRSEAKYLNALHYADHVMGQTVRAFEQAGFAKDTLFFLIADHGEAFGRHRSNYNHPFFLYEENLHVPFLIYNSNLFPRQQKVERPTRHVDLLPTILDILTLRPDRQHQGRSVLRAGRPQIAYFNTTWRNDLFGLKDGDWKLIYNQKTRQTELYNLADDPAETKNLAAIKPQLVERYHRHLLEYRAYQRRWYETVTGKPIDWTRSMSKDGL